MCAISKMSFNVSYAGLLMKVNAREQELETSLHAPRLLRFERSLSISQHSDFTEVGKAESWIRFL